MLYSYIENDLFSLYNRMREVCKVCRGGKPKQTNKKMIQCGVLITGKELSHNTNNLQSISSLKSDVVCKCNLNVTLLCVSAIVAVHYDQISSSVT